MVCTSKAAEWNERVRARTEELAGINKALEILTSDDAKALFNKAIKPGKETFLQGQSVQTSPRNLVYETLKKHATKSKSLRLAALAASVRASGHFDTVIEAGDKMIADLKKEAKDDRDHKDWCKEETFKNEQEASRYEYKISKLNGKLAKLKGQVEELEATLAQTIAQIAETNEDIEKMEDSRKEAHAVFQSKKADDEGASKLLGAAIESMSAFYKNNKTGMGEIQGSVNLLQRGPEFEVSADEVKNGVKEDIEAQVEFEAQVGSAKQLVGDLTAKKVNLESDISSANDEVDSTNVEKSDNTDLRNDEHEYLWSIKPDCTWILTTFEDRRKKRDIEIDGLQESKGMLQGAAEEGAALVQKKATPKFDDDAFGRLNLGKLSA